MLNLKFKLNLLDKCRNKIPNLTDLFPHHLFHYPHSHFSHLIVQTGMAYLLLGLVTGLLPRDIHLKV